MGAFAGGGVLRREGQAAVVGDGGEPELLVQGKKSTQVIPMSAIQDVLQNLGGGQGQTGGLDAGVGVGAGVAAEATSTVGAGDGAANGPHSATPP